MRRKWRQKKIEAWILRWDENKFNTVIVCFLYQAESKAAFKLSSNQWAQRNIIVYMAQSGQKPENEPVASEKQLLYGFKRTHFLSFFKRWDTL